MSDVDQFVRAAEGIAEATSHRKGSVLHTYHGTLTDGTEVRLITPAPEQSSEVQAAFKQAADQWSAIGDHENVVTVHDRGNSPRPWLATDRVGDSLAAVHSELTRAEAMTVIDDAAQAIREATYYDFAHCDLTPEHIEVRSADDGITARVDDWGLRRVCHSTAGERPISPYTAPELLDTPDAAGEPADVYGLGAVAYFALTGEPPVDTDGSLESAIRVGDIDPPSTVADSLSSGVDDVLLRALAADPDDRYESGFVFRKALAEALDTVPDPTPEPEEPTPETEPSPAATEGAATVPAEGTDTAKTRPGTTSHAQSPPATTPTGDSAGHAGQDQPPSATDGFLSDRPRARAAGVAVGIGILGVVILVAVTMLVGSVAVGIGLSTGVAIVLGTVLGQYLGFAGLALTYLRRRGFTWDQIKRYLGVRTPTARELGLVVLGQLAIFAILIVVGIFFEFLDLEGAENEGADAAAGAVEAEPLLFIAIVLGMFLVVGPCEELLFRGGMQGRLRERFSAPAAIVLTSAVFAPVHVVALAGGSIVAILVTISVLFVTSLVLGAVYEYTGNIVVPTLLHGLHNTIVLTVTVFGPEETATLVQALITIV